LKEKEIDENSSIFSGLREEGDIIKLEGHLRGVQFKKVSFR